MTPKDLLLVEDDVAQSNLLTRWLESSGFFKVTVAASGRVAHELIDAPAWALLITDIGLPDEDGFAVMRHARARRPGLPVVIITGSDEQRVAHRSIEHQADDFLRKPLTYAPFFACIMTHSLEGAWPDSRAATRDRLKARLYHAATRDASCPASNTLTVAMASAELMLLEFRRDLHDPHPLSGYCDVVAQGVEQVVDPSDTARQVGHMGALTATRIGLVAIVQQMSWLLDFLADEARVSLSIGYPRSEACVIGVADQLHDVVVHLVLDAMSAMSTWPKRPLLLSIRNDDGTACIDLVCMGLANYWESTDRNQAAAASSSRMEARSMDFCSYVIDTHGGAIEMESDSFGHSVRVRFPAADVGDVFTPSAPTH